VTCLNISVVQCYLERHLAGRVSRHHPSVVLCLPYGYWRYVMENGFEVFVPEQDVLQESKWSARWL